MPPKGANNLAPSRHPPPHNDHVGAVKAQQMLVLLDIRSGLGVQEQSRIHK